MHGKTFFYANYEGLRQRLDGTQIGLVPSPGFAAQAALTSPALIPILQAYPAGTSPTSNPSVWQYDAPGRQIDNEDSGMVRLDHYFSDRTTAFVRFNADEAVESIPTGQLTAKTLYDTKFNNGVVALSHVFTPVADQRSKVRRQSNHLSHGEPFAGSVRSRRIRLQFADRIFHHRLSVENFRSHRRCFLGKGQTHHQVRV